MKKILLIGLLISLVVLSACTITQSPKLYDCQKYDIDIAKICENKLINLSYTHGVLLECVRQECYNKIYDEALRK